LRRRLGGDRRFFASGPGARNWRGVVADTDYILSTPLPAFDEMDWAEVVLWHTEAARLARRLTRGEVAMAHLTSQLIVQLLDRVSGPARGVANSLRGISGAVRAANNAPISFSDRLDAAIARNNRAIANARAGVVDAVGAFYVLWSAISAAIQA